MPTALTASATTLDSGTARLLAVTNIGTAPARLRHGARGTYWLLPGESRTLTPNGVAVSASAPMGNTTVATRVQGAATATQTAVADLSSLAASVVTNTADIATNASAISAAQASIAAGPVRIFRTADSTPKNANNTLSTDSVLQFAALANNTYAIEFELYYFSSATADFSCTVTAPGDATGGWTSTGISGNAALNQGVGTSASLVALGTARDFGGAGVSAFATVRAVAIVNVVTAGTVGIQWAQTTSDASDTVVKKGSRLTYQRAA